MRLPSLSSKQIIRVLLKDGFKEAPHRGKGSHRAFFKIDSSGKTRLVILPRGKDIPRGTLLSVFDQAGLSREAFVKLL